MAHALPLWSSGWEMLMSRIALVTLAPLATFPIVAGAARGALLVALRFRILALRIAPLALLSQLVLRPRGPISPAWSFANSAAQGRHSSQRRQMHTASQHA